MIPTKQIYLMFCLIVIVQMKIPINFQTNDPNPVNILVFADFGFGDTLINSNQFSCDDLPSCRFESDKTSKATYLGVEYEYRYAEIKINFPIHDKDKDSSNNMIELTLVARINNTFNVLGLNDISGFVNSIPWEHEIVLDLKAKSMILQKYNSKGNL